MDTANSRGQFLAAFSAKERAAVAAIMGLLTIPIVSLVIIEDARWRSIAALLAFIIAVPTWWFSLVVARSVYRESGYLRIDRIIQVAAGTTPIAALLLYIISRGVGQEPVESIILAVALTGGILYVSYRIIADLFQDDDAHYRIEGDWLAYYRDNDAVQDAHSHHDFNTEENISFEPMYVLMFTVLALLLNVNLVAETQPEQAVAFLLTLLTVFVPFVAVVSIRIIEYDAYNEGVDDLVLRLGPPYIYGFVAVLIFSVLVYSVDTMTAGVISVLSFVPFVIATVLLVWRYKPSLFSG